MTQTSAGLIDQFALAAKLIPLLLTCIGGLLAIIGWFAIRWMNRVDDSIKDVASALAESTKSFNDLHFLVKDHERRLDGLDEEVSYLKNSGPKAILPPAAGNNLFV